MWDSDTARVLFSTGRVTARHDGIQSLRYVAVPTCGLRVRDRRASILSSRGAASPSRHRCCLASMRCPLGAIVSLWKYQLKKLETARRLLTGHLAYITWAHTCILSHMWVNTDTFLRRTQPQSRSSLLQTPSQLYYPICHLNSWLKSWLKWRYARRVLALEAMITKMSLRLSLRKTLQSQNRFWRRTRN